MPTIDAMPLAFPGHAIQAGESDPEVVLAIQRRLNGAGCGPVAETGRFASPATLAVKRFQMRFHGRGRPSAQGRRDRRTDHVGRAVRHGRAGPGS